MNTIIVNFSLWVELFLIALILIGLILLGLMLFERLNYGARLKVILVEDFKSLLPQIHEKVSEAHALFLLVRDGKSLPAQTNYASPPRAFYHSVQAQISKSLNFLDMKKTVKLQTSVDQLNYRRAEFFALLQKWSDGGQHLQEPHLSCME